MYIERDQKIFHSEEGKVQILFVVNANASVHFSEVMKILKQSIVHCISKSLFSVARCLTLIIRLKSAIRAVY